MPPLIAYFFPSSAFYQSAHCSSSASFWQLPVLLILLAFFGISYIKLAHTPTKTDLMRKPVLPVLLLTASSASPFLQRKTQWCNVRLSRLTGSYCSSIFFVDFFCSLQCVCPPALSQSCSFLEEQCCCRRWSALQMATVHFQNSLAPFFLPEQRGIAAANANDGKLCIEVAPLPSYRLLLHILLELSSRRSSSLSPLIGSWPHLTLQQAQCSGKWQMNADIALFPLLLLIHSFIHFFLDSTIIFFELHTHKHSFT